MHSEVIKMCILFLWHTYCFLYQNSHDVQNEMSMCSQLVYSLKCKCFQKKVWDFQLE